jgi:hypothetical protein
MEIDLGFRRKIVCARAALCFYALLAPAKKIKNATFCVPPLLRTILPM